MLHAALTTTLLCVLSTAGAVQSMTVSGLVAWLEHADGRTDDRLVAAALDALRAHGAEARAAGPAVARLLRHQSALYRNRDKREVVRLRAYLFATLADVGVPREAYPALLDALVLVDDRTTPQVVGAAARAAGSLGADRPAFQPILVSLLEWYENPDEFTLARFDPTFPAEEATNARLELASAKENAPASRPAAEEHSCCGVPGVPSRTDWRPPERRKALTAVDLSYVDQDGAKGAVKDLLGRPVVLTFFYTRCENAAKCSAAVSSLAQLQRLLAEASMDRDVRLVAATYEPAYDAPERLLAYGRDRGLRFGEGAKAIRLEQAGLERLLSDLDTPVGYQTGWVNTHGVQLTILDARGRVARQYHTVMWDPRAVVEDLELLRNGR
jgi:protein SCO1/2